MFCTAWEGNAERAARLIMSNLYKCDNSIEWDAFVQASPQRNVFCTSTFLNSLPIKYETWFLESKNQIKAGLVLVLDDDGQSRRGPFFFSMYHGALLAGSNHTLRPHKTGQNVLKTLTSLVENITQDRPELFISSHYSLDDVRSFSWHNYAGTASEKFDLNVRYTGLIDVGGVSFDGYLASVRTTRRQEFKSAAKKGLTAELSDDVEALLGLYKKTFERQDVSIEKQQEQTLRNITNEYLENGNGQLVLVRMPDTTPASANFFLKDGSMSYYLIGANDPEYMSSFSGTFCFLSAIEHLMNDGVGIVDVCGMNSPNRGDFKLSFNAVPTPYFNASIG